jgi:hypothetical protein
LDLSISSWQPVRPFTSSQRCRYSCNDFFTSLFRATRTVSMMNGRSTGKSVRWSSAFRRPRNFVADLMENWNYCSELLSTHSYLLESSSVSLINGHHISKRNAHFTCRSCMGSNKAPRRVEWRKPQVLLDFRPCKAGIRDAD